MPQNFPLVVLGATSMIGDCLMRRLEEAGYKGEVISRSAVPVPDGFTLTQMDVTRARNWIAPDGAVIISLIPLWLFAQLLPRLIGVKAIIAVGSTSVFSKAGSSSGKEQKVAAALAQAEALITEWCKRSRVHYTILRPTMVYNGHTDKNITRMVQFIRRFHFLPLAAPAKGLRQPIHADDVAKSIVGAIENEGAYDKCFNVAGGEVLSYRAMAERVFQAMRRKPRLVMLPTAWLAKAFQAAENTGLLRESAFGSAIFQRMNEDLVFDVDEGVRVLKYAPRPFEPEIKG